MPTSGPEEPVPALQPVIAPERAATLVRRTLLASWLLILLGLGIGAFVALRWPPGFFMNFPAGVAVELFLRQDLIWLLASALLVPLAWALGRQRREPISPLPSALLGPRGTAVVALSFLATTALAVPLVYHRYALSLDEFLARFQARALRAGHLLPRLPDPWADWAQALQPIFMRYDPALRVWTPGYRPGNAALLAIFDAAGAMPWAHVVFGTACVWAVARLARRLFPAIAWAPLLGALLLATSAQVWVTATTSYAMTPHLLVTLLWLLAFLRDDRRGHLAAMAVGVLGIGLHQVHVHPLIVAPFLLGLLRTGRRALAGVYACWYGFWILAWIAWRDLASAALPRTPATNGGSPAEAIHFLDRLGNLLASRSSFDALAWPVNLARFLAWQNLAFVPLLACGLWTIRRAPPAVRAGLASSALLLGAHAALMPGQGHGWGFRYLHPVLGLLVLIAVHGAVAVATALPRDVLATWQRVLLALGVISTAGLVLRGLQVEKFVRPYAEASSFIASLPAQVVVVDDLPMWFGVDLVRNDPFLRTTPIVLSGRALRDHHVAWLCRTYSFDVVDLGDLSRFGISRVPAAPPRPTMRQRAAALGCALDARD